VILAYSRKFFPGARSIKAYMQQKLKIDCKNYLKDFGIAENAQNY